MSQESLLLANINILLDKGLKFQRSLCNGCHDVLMMVMKLNDTAISNISAVDYHYIVNGISKSLLNIY